MIGIELALFFFPFLCWLFVLSSPSLVPHRGIGRRRLAAARVRGLAGSSRMAHGGGAELRCWTVGGPRAGGRWQAAAAAPRARAQQQQGRCPGRRRLSAPRWLGRRPRTAHSSGRGQAGGQAPKQEPSRSSCQRPASTSDDGNDGRSAKRLAFDADEDKRLVSAWLILWCCWV